MPNISPGSDGGPPTAARSAHYSRGGGPVVEGGAEVHLGGRYVRGRGGEEPVAGGAGCGRRDPAPGGGWGGAAITPGGGRGGRDVRRLEGGARGSHSCRGESEGEGERGWRSEGGRKVGRLILRAVTKALMRWKVAHVMCFSYASLRGPRNPFLSIKTRPQVGSTRQTFPLGHLIGQQL